MCKVQGRLPDHQGSEYCEKPMATSLDPSQQKRATLLTQIDSPGKGPKDTVVDLTLFQALPKCFTYINLFNSRDNLGGRANASPWETGAQRGYVTFPKPHS